MVLSKMRLTKGLIKLRRCAGWSAPVLFANLRRQVFSRQGPYYRMISEFNSSELEGCTSKHKYYVMGNENCE